MKKNSELEGGVVLTNVEPFRILQPTTREGDWLVFSLKSLTLSVTYPVVQYHSRKAEITLETPEDKVTRVAVPLHAGAGPQPENTITGVEIQDMIRSYVHDIEQVLSEKPKEKGEW